MSSDGRIHPTCSRLGAVALLARALRPWLGLALVCAAFSFHPRFLQTFWTAEYLPNILQQAGTNIIAAVGMTFVIMTGGIDLSVGSVMALCGVALGLTAVGSPPPFLAYTAAAPVGALVATAIGKRASEGLHVRLVAYSLGGVLAFALGTVILRLSAHGGGLLLGLSVAVGVGIACGLFNGVVITQGRVPPFVTTLGMLTAARGLTVYATGGNSVSGLPAELGVIGQGMPLVAVALVIVLAGALLLTRTRPGRYITAIGGNEEAARLSGVNVKLYKTLAYVICGFTSAVAAIVLTAKFRLADTGAGTNAELNAIAAVVIGGTSLSGGQGGVAGSFIGALTIAVLNAGLVLVGIPDTLQGVIIGGVIIITVLVDQLQRRARA